MSGLKRVVVGPFLVAALVVAGLAVSQSAGALDGTVVINEINYNPPDPDLDDAEFLELHNPGDTDVDLSGYTFDDSGSVLAGTTATLSGVLPAGGYAILTPTGSSAWAGIPSLGTLDFGLSGGGELLTLRDSGGVIVDELTYDDVAPWPTAADGLGESAELIDALTNNAIGSAWAASVGGPTPGMVNSVTTTPPTPAISNVVATPFEPAVNQPVTVVATVPGGGPDPILYYVVAFGSESSVTMNDDGVAPDVTAGDGVFAAVIPGQAAGELIRFRIQSPGSGNEYPTGDARVYDGVVVDDPGEIATGLINMEWFIPESDYDSMFDFKLDEVYVEGSVLAIDGVVYDNMTVKIRGGNYARVNFDKQGLSFDFAGGVSASRPDMVPYPFDEFALSAERGWTWGRTNSAWTMYYAAGFPTVSAQHVRVQRNGEFYGIFRFSEKLDGNWRDEAGIDGDFYKVVSPGFNNPATGFERKGGDETDLASVTAFSAALNGSASTSKTAYLYDNVDIPNLVNFLAVSNLVGHFDSGSKNFYLHEDGVTSLWEAYPWDLTNTWGIPNGGAACNNGDALEVSCLDNALWDSIDEVPELHDMIFRRMRTLLDGPMVDGVLEGMFAQQDLTVSGTEQSTDSAMWNQSLYRTTSQINFEIGMRRNLALASADLPGSQVAVPGVVISELHYSPVAGVEFLELHNPTGSSVDLSGWTIDAVGLTVPGGTVMLPGDYLVLTKSITAFQAAYPNVPNVVLVQFSGGLSGGGETVQLKNASGSEVDVVPYGVTAPWPAEPTAGLVTLSLEDPADDNSLPGSWGVSAATGGTPGQVNDTVMGVVPPDVVINEIHYNPSAGGVEFIELYNAEATAVDVSGWVLDGMITFAPGTSIPSGDYLVATANLATFQSLYPGVAAVEWLAGEDLKNGGEGVDLDTDGGLKVDAVEYLDIAPWPTAPDGTGPSLELIDPSLDNALGANWEASLAMGSPGSSNIVTDSTAPVVSAVSPANGEVVPAGPTDVVAQVTDTESGVDRVRVHVRKLSTGEYWNGSAWVPEWSWVLATNSGGDSWTLPGVDATDAGNYQVLIWAWDAQNNLAIFSDNPQPVFSVGSPDVTAPVVSSVSPANGAVVAAGLTDVVAQVSDAGSGVDRVRVYVRKVSTGEYWNGSAWVVNWSWVLATNSGGGSWTVPGVDTTAPSDYRVLVWAWDVAGNRANYDVNPRPVFSVGSDDMTAPVVSSVTPANGEVVPAGLTDVVAQVSDTESGVQRVRIYVRKLSTGEYWNGSAWVASWSWVLADLTVDGWVVPDVDTTAPSDYRVLVWAWDVAGNRAAHSANPQPIFSVGSDDVTDPVVSAVTPANGEIVPTGLIDVVAQVSDTESGVDRVRIHIRKTSTSEFWNGTAWVPAWSWVLATDSGGGAWTVPAVDVADVGDYQVLVWAWDQANNQASWNENPQPLFTSVD